MKDEQKEEEERENMEEEEGKEGGGFRGVRGGTEERIIKEEGEDEKEVQSGSFWFWGSSSGISWLGRQR